MGYLCAGDWIDVLVVMERFIGRINISDVMDLILIPPSFILAGRHAHVNVLDCASRFLFEAGAATPIVHPIAQAFNARYTVDHFIGFPFSLDAPKAAPCAHARYRSTQSQNGRHYKPDRYQQHNNDAD